MLRALCGLWIIVPGMQELVEIAEFRRAIGSHDVAERRFHCVSAGAFRLSCPVRPSAGFRHLSFPVPDCAFCNVHITERVMSRTAFRAALCRFRGAALSTACTGV